MTLPPLLSLSFWFQSSPPPFLPTSQIIVLVVFGIFVLAGVIAAVLRLRPRTDKLRRELLRRVATLFIVIGLAGLLLYGFTYERILYFSMRLWWMVLFALFAVWAGSIARFALNDIPAARQRLAEKEKLEKWLPKKRK